MITGGGGIIRSAFYGLWKHEVTETCEAVATNSLLHFNGVEKAWADGATPNSIYTQVHPNMPNAK